MKTAKLKPRSVVEVEYLQKKHREEKDIRTRERIHAVLLYYKGYDPQEIAEILDKNERTISDWIEKYLKSDIKELRNKPRSGRPTKLSKDEEKELEETIINKTPSGFGYKWKIWDIKTVKDFVNGKYEAVFSYSGVWRMVRKRMGFSYGKPYQKDARQDPVKVKEFLEETLPDAVKRIETLVNEGKKVLVGLQDESHHQIKPNVQRALFKGKSIRVETLIFVMKREQHLVFSRCQEICF